MVLRRLREAGLFDNVVLYHLKTLKPQIRLDHRSLYALSRSVIFIYKTIGINNNVKMDCFLIRVYNKHCVPMIVSSWNRRKTCSMKLSQEDLTMEIASYPSLIHSNNAL